MYELFTFWEKKMLDGNFCHDLCIMVFNTQYDWQFLSISSFFKCQMCTLHQCIGHADAKNSIKSLTIVAELALWPIFVNMLFLMFVMVVYSKTVQVI